MRAPPGYELGAAYAEDRTGVLYRAVQSSLDRPVTLKMLAEDKGGDSNAIALFIREIAIVASLEHPNLLLAVDTGTVEGRPYLVTESTAEPTLAEALKAGEPMPEPRASAIALGLMRAIHHLETKAFLYKNLRPANVLLPRPSAPKLVTYRNIKPAAQANELRRSNVQSAAYCAPELVREDLGPVSARAGVYAVGAILYQMVAGAPAVEGPSAEVRSAHAAGKVPSLKSRCPRLRSKTHALVARLMAHDPVERPNPASAVALLESLASEPMLPAPVAHRRRRRS
ncbi:MAG: protein kinase domain-containing protein [Planctomycetaceae bacterium]